MIDAGFLAQNAHWFVVFGFAGLVVATLWERIIAFWRWSQNQPPVISEGPASTPEPINAAFHVGGGSANVSRVLVAAKDGGQFNAGFVVSGEGHKTISDSIVFLGGNERPNRQLEDNTNGNP